VSFPFFLRPFSGCVPQPEKRGVFDSHSSKFQYGCRVARHYIKAFKCLKSGPLEKQNKVTPLREANFRFPKPQFSELNSLIFTALVRRSPN